MDIHGAVSDPTWGPYAQHLTLLEQRTNMAAFKRQGARLITWIEGFGDCMLYAVALERKPDGSFTPREDDSATVKVARSHWSWAHREIPQGNTLRWVGLHNTINDEDFVLPAYGRARRGLPVPRYPDGRPAIGWMPDARYPLNARIYDACGAKDINGSLHPAFEPTSGVNETDSATNPPHGLTEGLYPARVGIEDVSAPPGRKSGDVVYCGVISVHKDISAPFWREYARASVREIVRQGLDGVWCDNYSPWDNFGYPPVQKAFGNWSVHRFHTHLHTDFSEAARQEMGVSAPDLFDIRDYLQGKAKAFGAIDSSHYNDPAWRDARWNDDPLWAAFKAFRQRSAQQDLRAFYEAIHAEARRAGRPDFCIGGNDIPLYGLGWVRDAWLDMVNAELTPGWHMGAGSRGIMIPPQGKMAVIYRIAHPHQKGPFCAAWYYLNGPYERHQQQPEIARTLLAEAFANGAFLLCDPNNKQVAGTVETHAWWNHFVRENEAQFGPRVPVADVGILFSPDNQLALLAPGGFPDLDRQLHVFGHYGWATALIDAHIPHRVLTDWQLDAAHLASLRALILPDAECLDASVMPALEAWVRKGGSLILTGPCGLREGPAGRFRQRAISCLASLVGADWLKTAGSPVQCAFGKGRVFWTPTPSGMDYYLQASERLSRLPEMVSRVGPSSLVAGEDLLVTVGLSLWKAEDGRALFADLVNYDLDADNDHVRPAEDLHFRVRLPRSWQTAQVQTLSPDAEAPATLTLQAGWAVIRLPRLVHFASVKLSLTY
jgi:hypothetical protein